MSLTIENWRIKELTGYKPITTFYQDFSIADKFGEKEIYETYCQAFKESINHYEYLTELVMVLNWKIWRWYGVNDKYAELYDSLWRNLSEWCEDNLKDEELEYYYETID